MSAVGCTPLKVPPKIEPNKTQRDNTVNFCSPLPCGNLNVSVCAILMNGTIQLKDLVHHSLLTLCVLNSGPDNLFFKIGEVNLEQPLANILLAPKYLA